VQALHEERVPVAERGERQHAHGGRAAKAQDQARVDGVRSQARSPAGSRGPAQPAERAAARRGSAAARVRGKVHMVGRAGIGSDRGRPGGDRGGPASAAPHEH